MALIKVSEKNVISAIVDIADKGVPTGRSARKYALVATVEDTKVTLPPKYVYCVAAMFAAKTDEPLSPDGFSATEAIARLRALGFEVVEKEVS